MSSFTTEMIQKAKEAKTAEELLSMAKANNIEMTLEEAQDYFAQINVPTGELDDDELDNVAGGGCGTSKKWGFENGTPAYIPKNHTLPWCCEHVRNMTYDRFRGTIWFGEIQYGTKGNDEWWIFCIYCGTNKLAARGNGDPRNYGIYR